MSYRLSRRGRWKLFSIYKSEDLDDVMSIQMDKHYAYCEGYRDAYRDMMEQYRKCEHKQWFYPVPKFEVRSRFSRYVKHLEKLYKQWRNE